jgi:hypothetical protein
MSTCRSTKRMVGPDNGVGNWCSACDRVPLGEEDDVPRRAGGCIRCQGGADAETEIDGQQPACGGCGGWSGVIAKDTSTAGDCERASGCP